MAGYSSYYTYKKYVAYHQQDPLPYLPITYSVDGEGTKPLLLKEACDINCGCVIPIEPIYRWVNMNPSTDYVCDNCDYSPIYRWVNMPISTDYVCENNNKYYKQIRQVSYDNGETWEDMSPVQYQKGVLYEQNSVDCGYIGYATQYLTFRALESGTFKFSGNSVSYSLDSGATWTSLASNTNTPTIASGDTIMWKASGLTPIYDNNKGIGRFSSTGIFEVEGNIMSLVSGDSFSQATSVVSYQFMRIFNGCTGLTSAENLVLPATTLAYGCYNYMFYGCTSLTTAPSLPATTLADNCYDNMFRGCTSLSVAPSLPARMLASYCYRSMFYGCTSLTTAPSLPARILPTYCYAYMFSGCNRLNNITCLATNISAYSCTRDWVDGVASTGTFTKAAGMNDWPSGSSGIPNGWTVVDYDGN